MKSEMESVSAGASFDAIDAFIERDMRRLNIPGVSLAIVEGDEIVHMRGYGRAGPNGRAPSPTTPFPIASVSKSFVALAVMQLAEAGKLVLDDPVQYYLSWFRVADPQASARITVRHLLNQTSGLPTWTGELITADFDDSPGAAERQARTLSTLVLARAPGSAFEYSNSNYQLLGLIIEAASGKPYADYIRDHILAPLDMSRTTTSPAVAKQNGLAAGHRYWFMTPVPTSATALAPGATAGGGLYSTAEDMAHYMIAMLNGGCYRNVHILSDAGIDELQRGAADMAPQMPPEMRALRPLAKGFVLGRYAMGWTDDKLGSSRIVWHGGTLPDFSAYMGLLPGQKKGVVLLVNACHHWLNPVLAEFGLGVTALLAGEQPPSIPFFRMIPWALRGLLLIPVLQLGGVVADLCLLRRLRADPDRAADRRAWALPVLLPLIPNLLMALTLIPMLGKRRRYLLLYKPDSSWIVLICGSLALIWSIVRSGLLAAALKRRSVPRD
jgi:CubicO group peptidase (beta-lactamase class C family)